MYGTTNTSNSGSATTMHPSHGDQSADISVLSFDNSLKHVQIGTVNGAVQIHQISANLSGNGGSGGVGGSNSTIGSNHELETFPRKFRKVFQGGETIHVLQVLSERFFALLIESSPQLYIYDMEENRVAGQVSQPFSILSCQSCLKGAVICLVSENQISVHLRLRNNRGEPLQTTNIISTTTTTTTSSSAISDFYMECLVFKTGPNPNGLCTLSAIPSTSVSSGGHRSSTSSAVHLNLLLTFPSATQIGHLEVVELGTVNLQASLSSSSSSSTSPSSSPTKTTSHHHGDKATSATGRDGSPMWIASRSTLKAHESSIRVISVDRMSNMIAVASERGTVIRLFRRKANISSSGGTFELWKELRRGTYQSTIYCLKFSYNSQYLGVTSSTGTLHIFDLWSSTGASGSSGNRSSVGSTGAGTGGGDQDNGGGWISYLTSLASSVTPSSYTYETSQFKKHGIEGHSICCFNRHQPNIVYVVTKTGQFVECHFDYSDQTKTEPQWSHTMTFTV